MDIWKVKWVIICHTKLSWLDLSSLQIILLLASRRSYGCALSSTFSISIACNPTSLDMLLNTLQLWFWPPGHLIIYPIFQEHSKEKVKTKLKWPLEVQNATVYKLLRSARLLLTIIICDRSVWKLGWISSFTQMTSIIIFFLSLLSTEHCVIILAS